MGIEREELNSIIDRLVRHCSLTLWRVRGVVAYWHRGHLGLRRLGYDATRCEARWQFIDLRGLRKPLEIGLAVNQWPEIW